MSRDKVRIADSQVIYICLEQDWNTIARKALADAMHFRNMGGNLQLICFKESALNSEAEKQDIPRLFMTKSHSKMRLIIELYLMIEKLIKHNEVDLIHTYNYLSLLALGACLRRQLKIPLFYTCNEDLAYKYLAFWHDYAVSRVDLIFTLAPSVQEEVQAILPIHPRKVMAVGAGIDVTHMHTPQNDAHGYWKLCTFIQRDDGDFERFVPLIRCIEYLVNDSKEIYGMPFVLHLLTDISWSDHPLHQKLKSMILERGLEHYVTFQKRPLTGHSFVDQHLYIGMYNRELFNDVELMALMHQTPVLLPRTSARKQMLLQKDIGATYMDKDVRELKQKLLMLLSQHRYCLNQLQNSLQSLVEFHHLDRYLDEIHAQYEKLVLKRSRFVQKGSKTVTARP